MKDRAFPFAEQKVVEGDDGTLAGNMSSSGSRHSFEGRPDAETWNCFQQKHEGAFTYIYDNYFEILYYYGCQLTRDKALVEDLLQDFFVTLRLNRRRMSEVFCIKAYLLKSFRRRIVKHLKKKKLLHFSDRIAEDSFNISFYPKMPFIQQQFEEEQQKYIAQMLNRLTTREREAVYHFYFENLDYKSIADVMELNSAKSARNLIYKALSSLKKSKHLLPEWLQYCIFFLP